LAGADQNERPVVCVDLDGVLNTYDEWRGPEFFHPPREGAREFLESLHSGGYRVVVFTVRWHEWVRAWLDKNGLGEFVDDVTDRKPPAIAYVDDRAVCFRGDFEATLRHIRDFRPFWEPTESKQ
jgi:hypothetical protein